MASTTMETDTLNGESSGCGTAIQEIQDENVLREMWQDTEDPEEKRILRSRMYKLREDRIKEYYGREGHDILESILNPNVETSVDEYSGTIDEDDGSKTTFEGNREQTVSSAEAQSPDGTVTVKSSGFQVKQSVTAVTTSEGSKAIVDSSSMEKIKNRISKKDRTSQFKEIRGAQEKSPRRKASSGDIEIINVKKVSSTTSGGKSSRSSNATSIGTIYTANNNNKVIANNIRNGTEHSNNGLSSAVQKRSRKGEGVTKVVNGKSSITSTTSTTTTMGGTKSSKLLTEGNKMTERGESQSSTMTTTVTRKSQAASSMTTMKSMTTTTTSSFSSQSSSSVTRMLSSSSSGLRRETSNLGNMITSSGDGKSGTMTTITNISGTATTEQIPIGSVQIEEIVEKPQESVKLSKSSVRTSSATTVSSGSRQKDFGNRIRQTKADADIINRNLANTNTTTTTATATNILGSSTTQATKSELTKTSSARACSRASSANANANGNTTNGSAIKDKSSKVVNKSRETSPKRSGKGVVGGGGPSASPTTTTPSGPARGSKTNPKTGETLPTPTIKVDRVEDVGKADKSKTEESIIRELDILDTFLSQRSTSIDEAAVKEETVIIANVNGTMGVDHRKKVPSTPYDDNDERVDVMESGLEPPFTRKEYKYGCPGDDHPDHHHHDKSTDKNTDEGKRGKTKPKSTSRDTTGRTRNDDTRKSNNIEDEIIVADEMTTTSEIRSGKSERKASPEKSVKLLRQKDIKGSVTERTAPTSNTTTTANSSSPNNLSSRGTSGRGKANNVKKPEESSVVSATTAFTTGSTAKISSTTTTTTTKDILTKQQKYEADILSRPSVLQKKSPERPNPNPRIRKGSSDSSPERDLVKRVEKSRPLEKPVMVESDEDNEDVEDNDLLKPQKVGKGLESPGAVLKAKSLFETKAQEAAMDRSSADFDMDKGLSRTAKVSKKAALFEARSRGERVSISSESSVSVAPEEKEFQSDELLKEDTSLKASSLVRATMKPESQFVAATRETARDKTETIVSDSKTTESLFSGRRTQPIEKTKQPERDTRKSTEGKAETNLNTSRKRSEATVSQKSTEIQSETVADVRKSEARSTRRSTDFNSEAVATNTSRHEARNVRKSLDESPERVRNLKKSETTSSRRSSDLSSERVGDAKKNDLIRSRKSVEETSTTVRDSGTRILKATVTDELTEVRSKIEKVKDTRLTREETSQESTEKLINRNEQRQPTEEKRFSQNEPRQVIGEKRLSREEQKQSTSQKQSRQSTQKQTSEISEERLIKQETEVANEKQTSLDERREKIEERRLSREDARKLAEEKRASQEEQRETLEERRKSRDEAKRIADEKREEEIEERRKIREEAKRIAEEKREEEIEERRKSREEAKRIAEEKRLIREAEIEERRKSRDEARRISEEKRASREEQREAVEERRKSQIEEDVKRLSERRRSSSRVEEDVKRFSERRRSSSRVADDEKRLSERRRSSSRVTNTLDSKFESTAKSTTQASTTTVSSNRMTTSELNAIDFMEDIEELERLLDRATDYDERSKIRGRIRALKRKIILVKKTSTEGDESPEVNIPKEPFKDVSIPKTNETRRRSSVDLQGNKVTTRKKSSELAVNRTSSSRRSVSETRSKTEVNTDTESKPCRRASRERRVSKESTPVDTAPRKIGRQPNSKSPSPTRKASERRETEERRVSGERRLSTETQELLSTRRYSRERVKDEDEENKSPVEIPFSSRRNSRDGVTPTSSGAQSPVRNLSRRNSRDRSSPTRTLESVPEVQKVISETKKNMTKAEKYEADILSRPSVFQKKRQVEEAQEIISESKQRSTRDSVSPQRSEIPISNRMKTARETTSPPKTVVVDTPKTEPSSTIISEVVESKTNTDSKISTENSLETESSEIISSSVQSSKIGTTRKVSSRTGSDEIRRTKTKPEDSKPLSGGSRRNSGDQSSSVSRLQRRQSIEEGQAQKTPSSGSSSTKKSVYTRKSSSKELKVQSSDSAEQSGSSKIPTKEKGETTKDDCMSVADKANSMSNAKINSNQQQQSSESPTQQTPVSTTPSRSSSSSNKQQQQKTNNELTTRGQQPSGIRQTSSPSSTTRKVTSTNTSNKNSSLLSSTTTSNNNRLQGTETVTSSYGVGPTDDEGIPLFGLRALRKIKQAQEQMATNTTSSPENEKSSPMSSGNIVDDSNKSSSLRSSENFGLRALKKGSAASRGFDETGESKSPVSSVPQGSTRESKSESVLSSSRRSTTTTSSSTIGTSGISDGTKTTNTTSTTTSEQTRGISTSPKSILKKTSSFTSQSSGVVKSKTEEGNNFDEIGTSNNDRDELENTGKNSEGIVTTTTITSSSLTTSAIPHNNLDDFSWRRKSVSPSPEGQPQGGVTTMGTFSRGKVGRSSVKEMSRRFETSENTSSSATSESMSTGSVSDRNNRTSFIRADSPSRIPSPIRSTTTTTTTTKTTVQGNLPDSMAESYEITHHNADLGEQSDSDSNSGGLIRVTRKTVTKSSGRSFLTDQSPIQNLTDVIERMKGEDCQSQFAEDFKDDEDHEKFPASDGRSLLNKFIGAQIIMQAVEPMLITQKVSMSSSLVINGVDVDSETNSAKLRQLLAEVDDGGDRERIEIRLRNLESESSEGMKGVERSSSSSSSKGNRQLTKTLSISGVQLGASDDVTGELMPLILGQLQSSLDNIGASSSGSGIHIETTQSDSSISSSHNSSSNNHNSSASSHNNTNSSSDSNVKCIGGGSVDRVGGGEVLEQSASAETVGSEECLFDSGTESGEDVANLSSPGGTANTSTSSAAQHSKSVSSPAEFSNFMEGLRNTLKRNQNKESLIRSFSQIDAFLGATASEGESALGVGNNSSSNIGGGGGSYSNSRSNSIGDPSASGLLTTLPTLEKEEKVEESLVSSPSEETDLVQQVDKVLTLLRDSLVKDPNCLKALGCADLDLNPDPEKGKELIALIDRLKSSLVSDTSSGESGKRRESLKDKEKQQEVQKQEDSGLPRGITTNSEENDKRAEMLSWAQTRPPDIVPLPWVNHIQSSLVDSKTSGLRKTSAGGDDVPWKMRAGRRRSHGRSHTVGVTQEELAEARRYLQEAAYRNAYEEQKHFEKVPEVISVQPVQNVNAPSISNDELIVGPSSTYESNLNDDGETLVFEGHPPNTAEISMAEVVQEKEQEIVKQTMGTPSWQKDVEKGLTSIPRPFVKPGMYDSGYQPPPERRMTYASIDDSRSSILGNSIATGGNSTYAKIKPFRTFSLDNAYDPSKTLFTKEETVQIAIHQAAIKKQMSEEEDRRKRRNSLSSYHNIYGSGTQPARDFSLALPKPYSPPQNKNQEQQQQQQSPAHLNNRNNSMMGNVGNRSQSNYPTPLSNSAGDSGYTEESGSDSRQPRNDQLVLYESSQMSPASTNSPSSGSFIQLQQQQSHPNNSNNNNNNMNNQRIENVQISLKELNSSEFPQLQIAITLNTNNNGNNNSNPNSGSYTNSNNESSQGNIQSQFHPSSNNNNNPGNNPSGKQNNPVNPGPTVDESTPTAHAMGSGNKAMRYKSKNERKNRLKRANTIDIPQPPGFLLSNDDDSEMEDEEDSDGNINNSPVKTVQFTYAPFKPKTDGDRKFLAFLEKNNALTDTRPVRPSYLGVNDKFWNNRFFNLKSSFESSSQGSSPSRSPVLSPNRAQPRSASEMALTHGITPSDTYSKPVWAMTDPGQLPQQVKNKLQVFETKSMELQPKENPWRPSIPQNQVQNQNLQYRGRGAPNQPSHGGPGQFVSSSSVYSTNSVRPQMLQEKNPNFESQNYDSNLVKRPVAMKPGSKGSGPVPQSVDQSQPPVLNKSPVPPMTAEGVHMVHATASALEAMKRSGFGPTAVVQPQRPSHHQQSHSSQPPPIPPKSTSQDKVELPWAKKDQPLSPVDMSNRDPNAGRILMSKAKFEQMSQPEPVPMHPAVAHGAVVVPPPIPPKSNKLSTHSNSNVMYSQHPRAPMQPGSRQSFPTSSVPNVANLAGNYGQSPQYASGVGTKPKLGAFGVTQSFDEAFKRKMENEQPKVGKLQLRNEPPPPISHQEPRRAFGQVPQDSTSSISGTNNINNNNRTVEFQRVPGSAFARKVSNSEPPSRRSSGQEEENAVSRKSSIEGGQEGVMIQTPVVAKVMRGPQQQRAVMTSNRMSSINDDHQSSRLTNARSNIRNILNQYQAQGHSDSSDTSPPILKANLQLSLPPLTKSMSGDALLQTHFLPASLVVGPEELSLQRPSPNSLKQYSPPSTNSISPASLNVSPVAPSTLTQISPIRRDPEPLRQPQKPQNPVIPKQRSLSEFPKIGSASSMGVLTIQTDLESLTRGNNTQAHSKPQQQKQQNVPVQQKPIQQQAKQLPVQQKPTLPQQPHPKQQQIQQQQQPSPSAPKVLKSYPTTDSLQRTSSGSSIFNRAQSLFLVAQDGIPPATKARLKPPTLPKTHGVFPKQFEAQMSPDSANKKQREIEAYFKQQQQQQLQEQKAAAKASASKGTQLRKSASHSKIMNRQRSISDGEEDVDQIFESLFKASAEASSLKSAEKMSWGSSSSKSFDMSESKRMSQQQSTTSSVFSSSQVTSVAKTQISNNSTFQNTSSSVGGGSGLNRFKQMDQQAKANNGGAPLFKFANPALKASANSAKDILLYWCQCRTRDYENVKIENFSSSWSDGLAFCALIHHFYPDAFDYNSLDPRNRRYNFDLAFRIADEKAGIYPLLDTEDMIAMGRRPDWKCVFTYVQAMYQKLKEMS